MVAKLGERVEVGIHTHNDAECAVANSLAAVARGRRPGPGHVNGYGERCGNANLASILPALQLKMGFEVVTDEQLATLTETVHFLDELCNVTPDPDQPYVGRNAFAHKAGMHVAGVARRRQHLRAPRPGHGRQRARRSSPPSSPARRRSRSQAERAGLELDDAAAARAVERLKEREHRGYHYEAAPASFELLLRREAGGYEPLFKLESFRVDRPRSARTARSRPRRRSRSRSTASATCESAEGNGPVNALDKALREAIADRHPHLADIELTNYKVRILDETHGTGAVTRVLLDSSDGEREWGTIGVSENIIEASWEALVDSLEYAFQPHAERSRPARRRPARLTCTVTEQIPLAQPELGAREEELVARGAALRAALAGADGRALRARLRRLARGRGRGRRLQRHGRAAPRRAGARLGRRATRSLTSPFSFVASANCLLYEGARPVFCDVDPVTLNLDPARRRRPRSASAPPGILPVHIFGYPAAMPELEALAAEHGLGILEDACEALGAVDSEGRGSAPAATSRPSPSTPTSR